MLYSGGLCVNYGYIHHPENFSEGLFWTVAGGGDLEVGGAIFGLLHFLLH